MIHRGRLALTSLAAGDGLVCGKGIDAMDASSIKHPPAGSKASRRADLRIGVLIILVGSIACLWISKRQPTQSLGDRRMVFCDGVLRGRRVNDTEFEHDLYVYPSEWFLPTAERYRVRAQRLLHAGASPSKNPNRYSQAPWILIGGTKSEPSGDGYRTVVLADGFGGCQQLFWPDGQRAGPVNYNQLPMGSSKWIFQFRNDYRPVGKLVVANPCFNSTERFAGHNAPLEQRTSNGTLKLVSAVHSFSGFGSGSKSRDVTFEFDASACPDLLPCHVVGVRITDSWGNTRFLGGALTGGGKTIRARWPMDRGRDDPTLQSPHCHVQIAICRGKRTSYAPGELAVFDHLTASGKSSTPTTHLIDGRQLTMIYLLSHGSADPREWRQCFLDWKLEPNDSLRWPIVVRMVGRTAEGSVVEIDPTNPAPKTEWDNYGVWRQRVWPPGGDDNLLTKDLCFEASVRFPPEMNDFDLHVTLEEMRVFEFFVKVANWPAAE